MPGTLTPGQMFDHTLAAVKGWHVHAVDKEAELASEESGLYAGSVVYLDANAKFASGLATAAMPIFLLQGSDDFDANADSGNITGGISSGLVGAHCYELESTEFVAGSYVPNDKLTVVTSGDNIGKLTEGVLWTNDIVGVVSADGATTNENGKSVIRFWSVYLPLIPS